MRVVEYALVYSVAAVVAVGGSTFAAKHVEVTLKEQLAPLYTVFDDIKTDLRATSNVIVLEARQ